MSEAVVERADVPGTAGVPRVGVIRAVAYLVVAACSVVIAALVARHGIRVDTFPPYVAGDTETRIRQFSGPWIAGAFGLVALAALLVVAAVADLRLRVALPPEPEAMSSGTPIAGSAGSPAIPPEAPDAAEPSHPGGGAAGDGS
jgi:hypothetical protein